MNKGDNNMEIEKILAACDHTLLRPDARWSEYDSFLDDAMKYKVASACIPPCFVRRAKEYTEGKLPITTVIGFPHGTSTIASKAFEAKNAIEEGADEIDMVMNVAAFKGGESDYVLEEIRAVKAAVGDHILKVIVEACMLNQKEKIEICRVISESGADFLKTSTVFAEGGAVFTDVKLFKEHLDPKVQIKAAGGIASLSDAQKFLELGATRLGTSRIVKLVKDGLG